MNSAYLSKLEWLINKKSSTKRSKKPKELSWVNSDYSNDPYCSIYAYEHHDHDIDLGYLDDDFKDTTY